MKQEMKMENFKKKINELEKWISLYKAMIDDYTKVEYLTACGYWVQCSKTTLFSDDVAQYRIKPGYPEFKAGDWVYITLTQGATELRQFEKEMEKWVNIYNISLWKPKQGEWCVFWFEAGNYTVLQYETTVVTDTHPYKDRYGFWENGADNIAPLEFVDNLCKN